MLVALSKSYVNEKMVKLYTSGLRTLRELRMFGLNARNIAFNLNVFCVYKINTALWLQYSSWVKLNPDHKYTITFAIGCRKSRETRKP